MPLTRPGLIAATSAGSVDPLPTLDGGSGARRSIILFALIGIGAYLLALIVTMPASVIFPNGPWRAGVAGTVWNGEVGIAGGASFSWKMAPLRSLTSVAFAADWRATGPDTDLGGQMIRHIGGRTVLDHVSGSADSSLFRALQPNLPFSCNLAMQIEMQRIAVGGGARMADGKVTTDPGSCRAKNGGPVAVPALLISAEHVGDKTTIRVAPSAQRMKTLMTAVLGEDGALDISMTPEGAAVLPFVGLPGGTRIQGQM
jgi:hypothetical protein